MVLYIKGFVILQNEFFINDVDQVEYANLYVNLPRATLGRFQRVGVHSILTKPRPTNAGRITKDIYDIKPKEYKEKQYDLGIQKNELTKADEDYHIVAKTVLNIAQKAEEIFESSEVAEKNQFMKFLLQNPIVDGKKPVFAMREPFSSIAKASGHPTLLRLYDEI